MKKNSVFTFICTTVFLIGIIAILLSSRNPGSVISSRVLLVVSLAYLFSGWYIFKGYHPEGAPILLFLFGFLYASVFMAFTFRAAAWPLAGTFLYLAPIWAAGQLVLTVAIRKKLSKEGLIQFLTEGGIMLILTIVTLFRS